MKKIKMTIKITIVVMLLSLTTKIQAQEQFLGEIRIFPYNFAPRGWLPCNGQLLSIASNTALFSLIGTTYGGNGATTFALPDLRGRMPLGNGSGPGVSNKTLGEIGGTETVTILTTQMPAHTHTVNAQTAAGNTNVPTGNILGNAGGFDNDFSNTAPNTTMNANMVSTTGGNQPVSIMQPYLVIGYYIAIEGIFPSRP